MSTYVPSSESVILLHGLARTSRSMRTMERALVSAGYNTCNCNYPSRKQPIERLSTTVIDKALNDCRRQSNPDRIHFVTHSMGGILLRFYLSHRPVNNLGRIVMLAPPNAGSEIIDSLSRFRLFQHFYGPASIQLGTSACSLPNTLGAATFEVGIIAGDRSLNPLFSALIGRKNDGKVSVRSTRLDGMSDHIILPYSHSFMMYRRSVIEQTLHFLLLGEFKHPYQPND